MTPNAYWLAGLVITVAPGATWVATIRARTRRGVRRLELYVNHPAHRTDRRKEKP